MCARVVVRVSASERERERERIVIEDVPSPSTLMPIALMMALKWQGKDWSQITMVRRLLESTPVHVAEWILYMDSEAIFNDPAVTFAFEFYGGRDLIVTGSAIAPIKEGVPSECLFS